MVLKEELITLEVQHDLDEAGIAKTARQEKQQARKERIQRDQENARMARLYKQVILNEPATPDQKLVQLNVNKPESPAASTPPAFGD